MEEGGGDFCERFKSHVVAFDSFDMAAAREPSVAVHDEGDMLRDVALAERINKELLHVVDDPFDGRRREEPTAGSGGSVEGRGHCGNRYFSLGGEIETIESRVLGGRARRRGGRCGRCVVSGETRAAHVIGSNPRRWYQNYAQLGTGPSLAAGTIDSRVGAKQVTGARSGLAAPGILGRYLIITPRRKRQDALHCH